MHEFIKVNVKMIRKYFTLFLFFQRFLVATDVYAQKVTELIAPIKVTPDVWNTFDVSDLFFSETYNLQCVPNDIVEMIYDKELNQLKLRTTGKFNKIAVVRVINQNISYDFLIKSDNKRKVIFNINVQAKNVNLFGSFNGWNREAAPMRKNSSGIFEIELLLEPGNYEYKFLADGVELLDDDNPNKVPNGLGGINSLISVSGDDDEKFYLHQIGYDVSNNKLKLNFFFETEASEKYNRDNYIVLIDNEIATPKFNHYGREMVFEFSSASLADKDFIRIIMKVGKSVSNLQTIFLENGIPVKNNSQKFLHSNILYSLMIDRFKDGDAKNSDRVEHPKILPQANYYGGDLAGIYEKLLAGYFDSLSVSAIWISPVIENTNLAYQEYPEPRRYYSGYHGYWPTNPRSVEEKFGDMEFLKKLIDEAHKRKIKILLDFVANHVHEEHPYWKEHRDWFGTLELPDGRRNLRLWDEHRLTTWFEPFMPSFDYVASRAALKQVTDDAIWWLKTSGADGFRHDAVKHVPNEFWRLLTRKIKMEFPDKDMFQIGETFGSYELVSSYVNSGQLHAQFNFNLYDAMLNVFADSNSSFSFLDQQMHKTFDVYGVNHLMGNVIDSHDKVRFMAYADGDITLSTTDAIEIGWNNPPEVDDAASYEKQKLAMTYLFTIPGLPVIYYGDEIGMIGAADPDNRRMMLFDEQLDANEKATLAEIRELTAIRKNSSALSFGDFYTLAAESNIYAYLRSDMNEKIIVVLNKGREEKIVSLKIPAVKNGSKFIDLISGEVLKSNENNISCSVRGFGYRILKISF